MIDVLFNRNPIKFGRAMEQPTNLEIKSTFGLWNASYEDSIRYGGDITRVALQAMDLHHDRKNIIVDTKIHMLMPGMSPSIPGWHADGAPRDAAKNPVAKGLPDTFAQEGDDRFNRYHLMTTGTGCLTKFINTPVIVPIPDKPSDSIYEIMSKTISTRVQEYPSLVTEVPTCTSIEFDWWTIHTGVLAKQHEWRFLIRVCESDYYQPNKNLREVIRMQSQVYAPYNFGW